MHKSRLEDMAALLRNRKAAPKEPTASSDPARWKRETINRMFASKSDAYDGAIDRAVLLIHHHAYAQSPAEVIDIIKGLKTDAPASGDRL